MSHDQNDEINLERRGELRHDEEAFQINQEEKRLRTARRSSTFAWIVNIIFWLAGILELLLGIKFLLRFFNANPESQFSQFINHLSEPFFAPFSTLFVSNPSGTETNVFDVNIIVAIAAYALLSYLLVSLVRFIFYHRL